MLLPPRWIGPPLPAPQTTVAARGTARPHRLHPVPQVGPLPRRVALHSLPLPVRHAHHHVGARRQRPVAHQGLATGSGMSLALQQAARLGACQGMLHSVPAAVLLERDWANAVRARGRSRGAARGSQPVAWRESDSRGARPGARRGARGLGLTMARGLRRWALCDGGFSGGVRQRVSQVVTWQLITRRVQLRKQGGRPVMGRPPGGGGAAQAARGASAGPWRRRGGAAAAAPSRPQGVQKGPGLGPGPPWPPERESRSREGRSRECPAGGCRSRDAMVGWASGAHCLNTYAGKKLVGR